MFANFNHLFAEIFYHFSFLRRILFIFPQWLYPQVITTYVASVYNEDKKNKVILWGYLITVLVCLIIQGYLAYLDGRFYSSGNIEVKNFLDDWHNIVNYTVLVPWYVSAGLIYICYMATISKKLELISTNMGLKLSTENKQNKSKIKLGGAIGLLAILLISLVSISNYAIDTLTLSQYKFWFHDAIDASRSTIKNLNKTNVVEGNTLVFYSFRGYYYVLLNYILNVFMLFVAFCHFGLFVKASHITSSFEGMLKSGGEIGKDAEDFIKDDSKLREYFEPFTTMTLTSKLFFAALVINMFTWHYSGVNGVYESGVSAAQITGVVLIFIGGWLVSFPRFYIELYIESLRRNMSCHTKVDLLTPRVKRIFYALNLFFITMFFKYFIIEIPYVKKVLEAVM